MSLSAAEFWNEYCDLNPAVDRDTKYETWYFGDNRELADGLYKIVLEGKKRATACTAFGDEPDDVAPFAGQYCVVTDFDGDPKCLIRLTEVRTVPFNEVDAEFAFDEGEGDQSLDYWRDAHWKFFSRFCSTINVTPTLDMPITCQRFELLHPKPAPQ